MIPTKPIQQSTTGVKAASITLSNTEDLSVKKALISQLTVTGFNLTFHHSELVAPSLKFQLHLHSFWYKKIHMYIPTLDIEIEGRVKNTCNIGNGNFKVTIEFEPEVPIYWRECLFDLWPKVTEQRV